MTDADPEDEARDVETPVDRPPDAGDAEPEIRLRHPGHQRGQDEASEEGDEEVKPPRGVQQRPQQVAVDTLSGG
jgi:hypothetical protein